MTTAQIFILIMMIILVIMIWVTLAWPVALVISAFAIICTWGIYFHDYGAYLCRDEPDTAYCAEFNEPKE